MKEILRNILAVILGVIAGSIVNMGLIMTGGALVPPPAGADSSSMESLKASMHLFGPEHFVFPFLAHALGTLAGALVAALIASRHKMKFSLGIGSLFLLGGITNSFLLPAPAWFIALDLTLAYIPMGYLGGRLAGRER